MIKRISERIFSEKINIHDSYSLVLVTFNCALLMDHLYRGYGILLIPIFFLLYNFQFWAASFIQITSVLYFSLPSFPRQPNHTNLEFLISIALLTIFFLKLFHLKVPLTPILTSYIFRVASFTMYFYSGFHKLNSDFFNVAVSCATDIGSDKLIRLLTSLGYQSYASLLTRLPFPMFTILLEMVIPFGLFWHKARKISAITLLLFHLYLGIYSFSNFTALAIFLLIGSVINFGENLSAKSILALRIYVAAVIGYIILHLDGLVKLMGLRTPGVTHSLSIITFSIGTLILFYLLFKENKSIHYVLRQSHLPALVSIIILLSFWALKNYVGLGTTGNFTMFSNLVTEKSRSNHWLIDTRKTKIWNFEEDYVQLVALDNHLKWQQARSKIIERTLIPKVEFSYLIRKWSQEYSGKITCTLIYNGQKLIIEDLKASRFAEYHWWYYYLPFRIIQLDGPNKCRW